MSDPSPPPTRGTHRGFAPLLLATTLGLLAGLGSYTFSYANGLSYFSTDPAACANCHIMQSQYDAWQKAGHHHAAACIDCHLPHAFVPKYLAKAENGWRHSKLFTTGGFVEPIAIQPEGRQILEANCVRCHAELTDSISKPAGGLVATGHDTSRGCSHCHASVGHGPRAALGGPLSAAELKAMKEQ